MKNWLFSAFLVVFMVSCSEKKESENQETSDEKVEDRDVAQTPAKMDFKPVEGVNYMINEGRAGDIYIGMSQEMLMDALGEDHLDFEQKAGQNTRYIVRLGENKPHSMEVMVNCVGDSCSVNAITVFDPNYQTAKGVKIGDKLSAIYDNYTGLNLSGKNTRQMVYTNDLQHVAFIIDATNIESGVTEPSMEDVAMHTPIIGFYLF